MEVPPGEVRMVEWKQIHIPIFNRTKKVLNVFLTAKGVEIEEV